MLETKEQTFQEIKNRVRAKISAKITGIKMIITGNLMMLPNCNHNSTKEQTGGQYRRK